MTGFVKVFFSSYTFLELFSSLLSRLSAAILIAQKRKEDLKKGQTFRLQRPKKDSLSKTVHFCLQILCQNLLLITFMYDILRHIYLTSLLFTMLRHSSIFIIAEEFVRREREKKICLPDTNDPGKKRERSRPSHSYNKEKSEVAWSISHPFVCYRRI